MKKDSIKIFEGQKIRTVWDEEREKWFISIVDTIAILTESVDPGAYWRKLKERLLKEGNETVTNCHSLKMQAADGKIRLTDVADTEQLFRLIQSIPSPKAEPFKLWLAQAGRERIDEIEDPEIGIWAGLNTRQYKKLKDLKKENLRDHMSNLELVLNMLAEATTTEISKRRKPVGLEQSRVSAKQGGTIAGNTRREIEEKTGKKIVTSKNQKILAAARRFKKLK